MNSIERLITHVVAFLPDSLPARKLLLLDAMNCLHQNEPMYARLRTMLDFLESHERQQLEFTKLFQP